MKEQQSFLTLPDKSALAAKINRLGFPAIDAITLFPFSSASPTFFVRFAGGVKSHAPIVVRGAMQNQTPMTSFLSPGLSAEVHTLKLIKNLGIHCSRPLHAGEMFDVPVQKHQSGRPVSDQRFEFFLMSYVHGVAVDTKIRKIAPESRSYYFDRIAALYAKLHSIKADSYGAMGEDGLPREKFPDLETYFHHLFINKCQALEALGEAALVQKLRRFFDDFGRPVIREVQGGDQQPAFVIYDSSAGNMLVSGRKIGLIDVTTAGFFSPAMEFCCPIVCMGDLLLEKSGHRLQIDEFLDSYEAHGGVLPPREFLGATLLLFMLNHSISGVLYFSQHRSLEKRRKKNQFKKISLRLSAIRKPTIRRVISVFS